MKLSPDSDPIRPVNNKVLLISRLIRVLLYILIEAGILFSAARRLDWVMAWLYLVGYSVYLILSQWNAPAELDQPEGNKSFWETVLVFTYRMAHPIVLVLAGLEFNRLGQQFPIGPVFQMLAFLFLLATFALMIWAEKANPQYHAHVITNNRWKHEVVSSGPYQFIRHPGYLGSFMLALARPLVLGSLLGLAPGILGAIVILFLTALEDGILQANLVGYKSYAQSVKYRLFEGIW